MSVEIYTICRFGFPRPVHANAVLNDVADLIGVPGSVAKTYWLARQAGDEQYVNDYCPAISIAWRANTDIQYIMGGMFDIVAYVSGYATKTEANKENHDLRESLKEAMSSKEGFKVLSDLLRQRQTGVFEIVDQLMSHSLSEFDCAHSFINTNTSDKRQRRLKSRDTIEKLADWYNVYRDNTYDVYYPRRSYTLEGISLFQMLSHFTIEQSSNKTGRTSRGDADIADGYHRYANPFRFDYHIHSPFSPFYTFPLIAPDEVFAITGTLRVHRKLNKPILLRMYFPNLEPGNEEAREDYYRRLVMMFIHYRLETHMFATSETVFLQERGGLAGRLRKLRRSLGRVHGGAEKRN